jgi:uncharacterized protein (TIGR02271 family)
VEGILGAYGAREFRRGTASSSLEVSRGETSREDDSQRVREAQGAQLELVEEDLRARTRPVQTGEVTIRKQVVEETRTVEVPVRREELIVEQHPVEPHAMDRSAEVSVTDPLVQQLMERLRTMQPGETLRIPIVQEEVVVSKRPVVVEEITLAKRTVTETAHVTDTVRREEARIDPHGDITVHEH